MSLLWVERQLGDVFALHREAQLALDERLNHQGEEVEREKSFDAPFVLQEHGRDLMHALDLLEALLDGWLALVGGENGCGREGAIVGEQRIHAVAVLVVVDGGFVEAPGDVIAATDELAVGGIGAWAAAPCLLEVVLLAHQALDFEVAPDAIVFEDLGDLQVDLCGPAKARAH